MDIGCFELRAANKDCVEKFSDIADKKLDGKSIFELACEYVNKSSSYKRNGRTLEILNIKDYSISVKLSSENKLEMASKSLAGFTRELLRIDKETNPNEVDQYFRLFTYNNTLFRYTQLDQVDIEYKDSQELSDVEALKKCVDLFCNGMTATKEEAAHSARMKKEIKRILQEHESFVRLNLYSTKMKG